MKATEAALRNEVVATALAMNAAMFAAPPTRRSARRRFPTTGWLREGRRACLLAHHGIIALGSDLDSALALAVQVETLAEMCWRTVQVGTPALLSNAELTIVLSKFAKYGQSEPGRAGDPFP